MAAKIKEFANATAAAAAAMRARRRMMRIMMMVFMKCCPVSPKGGKDWILHWKVAKSYGKPLLTW